MERNDGIIRWSPNPTRDEFMSINLNYRIVQIYHANGHAQPGRFEYQRTFKHNDFPPLTAYDWSPTVPGLVAMGNSRGEVNLVRIDDDSAQFHTLPLKLQRPCQSVAFSTAGLLAVGFDRVRNDACLQIWNLNQRLSGWDPKQPGWTGVSTSSIEPKKLEHSVSVASIRFFEDQPQTLVAGIKNSSVKVHDLRDPNFSVLTFQTRCNNNIAIDYADQNYFASSSLDQPGLIVWDRRAASRANASPMYLESIDEDEIPWGAALKLDRAIDTEKPSYIRQLRYCRDQRGTLGVLSGAGQLQVFKTSKEYVEPGSLNDNFESPELLEVRKSYDLQWPFNKQDHEQKYDDRIVSFDWINMGTSDVPGRVVALRAHGSFEIIGMPAPTAGLLANVIPWKPPQRLDENNLSLMDFKDPIEREQILGPLFATEIKESIPLFGSDRFTSKITKKIVESAVTHALKSTANPVANLATGNQFETKSSLTSLTGQSEQIKTSKNSNQDINDTSRKVPLHSRQDLHDQPRHSSATVSDSPNTKNDLIVHTMLRRAKEGYLFNPTKNKEIADEDPGLWYVWDWIEGAEEAAKNEGMIAGTLDLSYLGVYTIWNNLLGQKPNHRLVDSTIIPDVTQWEHLIASLNKKAGRSHFEGVPTSKPQHRQLCLAICGLVKQPEEFDRDLADLIEEGKFTTAAAWALFEGAPQLTVELLKKGGTDLLFIAMALDIKLQSASNLDINTGEWTKELKNHPQIANDPYLRAIYRYITSGDWASIANETALPLRDRAGVALRNFNDKQLTEWLSQQMEEAARTGHIEGIVLSGISDSMVDILAKYVEKFVDFQTPILIMSFCYPRYMDDSRCEAWRKNYKDFLQRRKEYILRVKFEQQSTIKSRGRDGAPAIKPPPRQVTIRCLKCDMETANDPGNSGALQKTASGPTTTTTDSRNPLVSTGINAGLCCPKCGSHLARCAICMEIVGIPRSDRPELSNDPAKRRMTNFPSFCLKCKHVTHMDHAVAWFGRHVECPVPECRCQCNERRQAPRDALKTNNRREDTP